jgi:predicted RNA-binding protein with TRAM domain
LRSELERDRTKTYVVEISPLGLVEMTRQNVTDGPREIMTRKCPTCGGDGIVYSEASAAIDVERRLRSLVAGSRSQAYRVELAAPISAALVGPGGSRLMELESHTKRRFFLDGKPDTHLDHFVVVGEGKLEDLAPQAPVTEESEVMVELVELDRHDGTAAVGKVDGYDVVVGAAAELVGKRVKVKIERVLDGTAYATLVRRGGKKIPEPLTAEAEAEKPTRKPPARKAVEGGTVELELAGSDAIDAEDELESGEEIEADDEIEADIIEAAEPETAEATAEGDEAAAAATAKKKTRRGSRGGRKRKKPVPEAGEETAAEGDAAPDDGAPEPAADGDGETPVAPARQVRIHVPTEDIGEDEAEDGPEDGDPPGDAASENGAQPAKKKTRRGSRGGKNRRKRATAAAGANGGEAASDEPVSDESLSENGAEPVPVAEPLEEPSERESGEDWGYVPMSEWGDEFR